MSKISIETKPIPNLGPFDHLYLVYESPTQGRIDLG